MNDSLAEAIAQERRVFDEELRATGLDGRIMLLVLTDEAVAGYGYAAVPVLPVPVDYGALLGDGGLDAEELAGAAARSIEILRPKGRSGLLGVALSIREAALRLRVPGEERLEWTIEAVQCFSGAALARLRGRCFIQLGTILRDSGSPYDALVAYLRAEDLLTRSRDEVGLAAVAYHRALIARSAALYEEGLFHLDAAEHRLADRTEVLRDGVTSEKTICLFESGDIAAAAAAVDGWITALPPDHANLFNSALPFAMRARIRLRAKELDAALDDLSSAARLAGAAIRQYTTRTFRSTERAQLQPLFAQAVRVALGADRADLALGVLLCEKSITPHRLRPVGETRLDWPTAGADEELTGTASALARAATGATVIRDLDAMRLLADRAGDLVDRADLLAGRRVAGQSGDMAVAAARLRGWLRPGELIIEYVSTAESLWAISIRTDGVRSHLVQMSDLDVAVLAQCVRAERTSLQRPRALDRLGRSLLDPVHDLIVEADRLYIVLSGNLQELPLHAVDFDGAPLVTRVEVAYLPSVEFLDPDAARPPTSARARVVAVPDPVYEVLAPLTAAMVEAARVADRLGTTDLLYEEDATATAFLKALGDPGLLHVTSHAAFEPQAPLLARLLLADRPVFAYEIALTRAGVTTVNLSGCNTASQLSTPGGEGEGLAAAFLAAGVPAVVASWWQVHDDAAAAFNDEFYGHLAKSGEAASDVWTAANAAQRVVLAQPGWDHPAIWAPFVVLGTPHRGHR